MPKSKEYIDDTESDSGDEQPKTKKRKSEPKAKKEESDSGSDYEKPKSKKEKPKAKKQENAGSGEESMLPLSRMRFVSVSEFRGKKLVNIREYYEQDGDLKPGRKGISLSIDQWEKLKEHMKEIDSQL